MRTWLIKLNGNALLMTILVSSTLLVLFVMVNRLPLWHTDIWAHLKYGSWMIDNHGFPAQEPFSRWSEPKPYVPFAWLSQVLMMLVYKAGDLFPFRWSYYDVAQPGGVDALRFLHALLVMLRFLFLYLAFVRWTGSRLISWLGIVFCISLGWGSLEVLRPQVWGELCFAIMLFLVCRQPPGRAGTWCMPLLMVAWSNMHGSYLSGLLVMLGFLVSRLLPAIQSSLQDAGGYAFHATELRRTFRMFYLSVLAIGIFNPLMSFRWYSETLSFAENANVRSMDEWQPLVWNSPQGMTLAGSVCIALATQFFARLRGVQGIGIGHALLLICFGLQVILFQRMLPWWAMLCPLVCVGPWARLLNAPVEMEPPHWFRQLVELVMVVTICWVGFLWSTIGQIFAQDDITKLSVSLHPATPRAIVQGNSRRIPDWIPVPFAKAIQRQGAQVFCSETLGDYLLFCQMPVVIYTHVQFFSPQHWQKCQAVKRGDPSWEGQLESWNALSVCVEAELCPTLCEQIRRSPNWSVFLDEAGSSSKPNPKSRLFIAVRK